MTLEKRPFSVRLTAKLMNEATDIALECNDPPYAENTTLDRLTKQMMAAHQDYHVCASALTAARKDFDAALKRKDTAEMDELHACLKRLNDVRDMNVARVRTLYAEVTALMKHVAARYTEQELGEPA